MQVAKEGSPSERANLNRVLKEGIWNKNPLRISVVHTKVDREKVFAAVKISENVTADRKFLNFFLSF